LNLFPSMAQAVDPLTFSLLSCLLAGQQRHCA
jgi:hypothetical protein